DLLVAEAAPRLPLRRDRLRAVAAAADKVEERRRELLRAGRLVLAEERRNERRLRVRRRLLLVLAVVAGAPLPPVDQPDEDHQPERRAEAEQREVAEGPPEMPLRVVELPLVAQVVGLVVRLFLPHLREPRPGHDLRTGSRAQHRTREDDPELDELVRADAD